MLKTNTIKRCASTLIQKEHVTNVQPSHLVQQITKQQSNNNKSVSSYTPTFFEISKLPLTVLGDSGIGCSVSKRCFHNKKSKRQKIIMEYYFHNIFLGLPEK